MEFVSNPRKTYVDRRRRLRRRTHENARQRG